MKKLFAILIALVAINIHVSANEYKVNDNTVDQMFANATSVSTTQIADFSSFPVPQSELRRSSKNGWIAWALTFTASFGVCGVHRLYLGSNTGVFIVYFCTAGGCGIIQTVDWVVLLIGALNNDISKYEDNEKLFMW